MANLAVVIGYCGSGKSKLLELIRVAFPSVLTMEEGFAAPGRNPAVVTEWQGILAALKAGRDCAVGSMECGHKEFRDDLEAMVKAFAPGTKIVWIAFDNDVGLANENCRRDTARDRDVARNIEQNDRWAEGYSVPDKDVVRLGIFPLPPRA
jgi:hypothetical protein